MSDGSMPSRSTLGWLPQGTDDSAAPPKPADGPSALKSYQAGEINQTELDAYLHRYHNDSLTGYFTYQLQLARDSDVSLQVTKVISRFVGEEALKFKLSEDGKGLGRFLLCMARSDCKLLLAKSHGSHDTNTPTIWTNQELSNVSDVSDPRALAELRRNKVMTQDSLAKIPALLARYLELKYGIETAQGAMGILEAAREVTGKRTLSMKKALALDAKAMRAIRAAGRQLVQDNE